MKLYSTEELYSNETINSNAIKFTFGHFDFLSNFHPLDFKIYDEFGFAYTSSEALYQAAKTLDSDIRETFTRLDAKQSKKEGKKLNGIRSDWNIIKFEVMRDALKQKFNDSTLRNLLLATSDYQLIEWTSWNDQCWGMFDKTRQGCNALGKLLMERRSLLNFQNSNEYF